MEGGYCYPQLLPYQGEAGTVPARNRHHPFPQEAPLEEPSNCIRRLVFRLVTSFWFEKVVLICIVVNLVFLSFEHYGQSATWTMVLLYANHVLAALFVIEVLLKLTGVCICLCAWPETAAHRYQPDRGI